MPNSLKEYFQGIKSNLLNQGYSQEEIDQSITKETKGIPQFLVLLSLTIMIILLSIVIVGALYLLEHGEWLIVTIISLILAIMTDKVFSGSKHKTVYTFIWGVSLIVLINSINLTVKYLLKKLFVVNNGPSAPSSSATLFNIFMVPSIGELTLISVIVLIMFLVPWGITKIRQKA